MKWRKGLWNISTFFNDKGMPSLATTIKEGSRFRVAYNVMGDLKIALKPDLYNEMIENSFFYSLPYLPVYGYMKKIKKWPMLCFTVMEWRDKKYIDGFTDYINSSFKNKDAFQIKKQIEIFIRFLNGAD
jgi:hypothetical protein